MPKKISRLNSYKLFFLVVIEKCIVLSGFDLNYAIFVVSECLLREVYSVGRENEVVTC